MQDFNLFIGKRPYIILLVIGLVVFGNTLLNEYALDDGLLITNNEYVQQGISGIVQIFTTSSAHSYFQKMGAEERVFTGGRYRPLSIATFALEHEFFGEVAWVRHFVNLIIYLIGICLIYHFLITYLFPNNKFAAFISCLIFLIHPSHSEVVANVKSRDELLSLFFIVCCLIYAFKIGRNYNLRSLSYLIIFYLLALFTKEYGVVLLIIIPLIFHIERSKFKDLVRVFAVLFLSTIAYGVIRFKIVGLIGNQQTEILNNPFLYANEIQGFTTKFWILLKYLWMLIFPYPVSSDYSFNAIPYVDLSFFGFWFSLMVYLVLGVMGYKLFKERNRLAVPFLFFLGTLLFVSNLFLEIGSSMSCRLVYHSSFGYAIVLGFGIQELNKKLKRWKGGQEVLFIGGIVYLVGFAGYSIHRNSLWQNDTTLFLNDVNLVPNSVLANGNAGVAYISLAEKVKDQNLKIEYLKSAVNHLNRAISIHPEFVQGYLNLGSAHFHLKDYVNMEWAWNSARKIFPEHPNLRDSYDPIMAKTFYKLGLSAGADKNFKKAINYLEKAKKYGKSADIFYHLGGAYYSVGDFAGAMNEWRQCLSLNPTHENAKRGLKALSKIDQ